ncbi:MAG: hypothetical protein V2A73_21175 [Pseudomonadota bacterium]
MSRAREIGPPTALLLACLLPVACHRGVSMPRVVAPREVPAARGAPAIREIVDLGNSAIPLAGALPRRDSDGVFVIGELLLVEGADFGRQPTVVIGGKPVGVVARTDAGGIIARVPTAIPAGTAVVEIAHQGGQDGREILVRRYGLVAETFANTIHLLSMTGDNGSSSTSSEGGPSTTGQGSSADAAAIEDESSDTGGTGGTGEGAVGKAASIARVGAIQIPEPHCLGFSGSGEYAYVASLDGKWKLAVVSLAASRGPALVHQLPVGVSPVVGVSVAEHRPLLVVVGSTDLQLFSLRDPGHPAPYAPFQLPERLASDAVVAGAIDPAGETLVLLIGKGNRLVAVDLSQPDAPVVGPEIGLLPGERYSLIRDVLFAADGKSVLVVSGENEQSLAAGRQPVRLTTVVLDRSSGELTPGLPSTQVVAGAAAPAGLAATRSRPLVSGSAIQSKEKAVVFLGVSDPVLLLSPASDRVRSARAAEATAAVSPMSEPGAIVLADPESGGGLQIAAPGIVSSLDVSPDSQLLLAATCLLEGGPDADAGKQATELGVLELPVAASLADPSAAVVRPRYLPLAKLSASSSSRGVCRSQLKIQP